MDSRIAVGLVIAVIVLGAAYYMWPKAPVTPEDVAVNTSQNSNSGVQPEAANNPGTTSFAARDPKMSGTWKSDTDAKFTREFRNDGVVIDRYEGEASAGVNGEWTVVDPLKEKIEGIPAMNLSGMTVIKVVWEGGVETTYFTVNDLTDTKLTTIDLSGRGSVSTYTKVN